MAFGGPLDLKLIELVKQNPLLYDITNPYYKDSDKREVTWKEIGDKLRRPARRCKLRWINIRDMLRKKIKNRIRYPEQHFKTYVYEKALSFMLPHFNRAASDRCAESFEDNQDHDSIPSDMCEAALNQEEDEVEPTITLRKIKHSSSESYRELNTADPIDVFLMTIGNTLRKFSPYYLNQAKGKIFQIVQDYELEQLMNSQGIANCSSQVKK